MFDWSKLIDLAEELLDHKSVKVDEEFIFRSAINRLYYGSHGTASFNLEIKGHSLPKNKVHGFVIDTYKRAGDPDSRKVGNLLARLFKYRRDADYNFQSTTVNNENYSKQLCEALIVSAREVCKAVPSSKV